MTNVSNSPDDPREAKAAGAGHESRKPRGTEPMLSIQEVQRLAAAELSLPARLGHVALLLAALTMACITGALVVTEPALPERTTLALALMSLVGFSWVAYVVWVLTRRTVLLARHRLIASRMAVAYSAMFAAAAAGAALFGGATGAMALALLMTGVVLLAVAIAMLVRARQRVRELTTRRAMLEGQLAAASR